MAPVISLLDLAIVGDGQTTRDALDATVAVARRAEAFGYRRAWYAEHHNMAAIASSATSVVIGHVAAQTSTIRVGSGGIMLPNHSPLTIAEQFGTLATLYGSRIDLGVGRAPGSDRAAAMAMRRLPDASDRFASDVQEIQRYLAPGGSVDGVTAYPGVGTEVPITVLGSSLFGARLAAHLGLPYGFASQFAPAALQDAVMIYRSEFEPSEQCDRPHVIAGVNAICADDRDDADRQFERVARARVKRFLLGEREVTEEQLDQIVDSPQGRQVLQMMTYSAVGTPAEVGEYLRTFAVHADADELIVVQASPTTEQRLRSTELVAEATLEAATA